MIDRKKSLDGTVVLTKALAQHDLWLGEPFNRAQAWVDLLLLANDRERKFRTDRGVERTVKRGQCAWSAVALAARWRWCRPKVMGFLAELERLAMIRLVKDNTGQIITLTNYETYNQVYSEIDSRVDNEPDNEVDSRTNSTPRSRVDTEDRSKKEEEGSKKGELGRSTVPAHAREVVEGVAWSHVEDVLKHFESVSGLTCGAGGWIQTPRIREMVAERIRELEGDLPGIKKAVARRCAVLLADDPKWRRLMLPGQLFADEHFLEAYALRDVPVADEKNEKTERSWTTEDLIGGR